MKKNYEKPVLDIIEFSVKDVLMIDTDMGGVEDGSEITSGDPDWD